MNWREVKVSINLEASEAVINLLQVYGARGVITENIKENKKSRQLITAYYPDNNKFKGLLNNLKNKIDKLNKFDLNTGEVHYQIKLCKDQDWNKSWHKFFKPTPAGKNFIICPSWEDCSSKGRIVINIDPGQAFGTGGHITTRLAVSLLEKYIEFNNIDNMLDIGTGTGILAIAAAKLGVKNIMGIDIDRAAIKAAQKNIKINNVSEYITIKESNLLSVIENAYQLTVVNMLPNIIHKLLPKLPEYLSEEGIIILSGINDKYEKEILKKLKQMQFMVLEKMNKDDWKALAAQKG